jgi:hypothetical protein
MDHLLTAALAIAWVVISLVFAMDMEASKLASIFLPEANSSFAKAWWRS